MSALITHRGGCHCRAVRLEVEAPARLQTLRCNCSICEMAQFLGLIVPAAQFRLISGEAHLSEYRFNTGAARHLFCRTCGMKPFYYPRSHPGGVSVNVHCLEPDTIAGMDVELFDGRNWEAAKAARDAQRADS